MANDSASSKRDLPVLRMAGLAVLLLAPMLAWNATSFSANGGVWFLGMLPAVIGLFSSPRLALLAAMVTPVWMGVALLLRDLPVPGTLYMTALGAAVGLSAVRGWHVVGAFAAPLTAFALIGAPQVAITSGTVPAQSSLTAGLTMMALAAAGGVWTTFVGRYLTALVRPTPPSVVPLRTASYYACALAILVGVATYVSLQWLTAPEAWWLVLTLFVVVQPYYAAASSRVAARVVGTLAGALVAIAVAESLQDQPVIIGVVAFVLTGVALWANITRPYWMYVLFLTPAVVLQTAGGSEAIVTSALDRALYTVVGSGAALVALTIGHAVITRRPDIREAKSPQAS